MEQRKITPQQALDILYKATRSVSAGADQHELFRVCAVTIANVIGGPDPIPQSPPVSPEEKVD